MINGNLALRKNYLDYLRIASCFAVILLHVSAGYYDHYAVETIQWREISALNSLTRWSVPAFVMISGACVLGRDYSMPKIKKAVIRFGVVYVGWAILYAGYTYLSGERLKNVLSTLVLGDTHMWFLPMIIGLYLLIPLLDVMLKNECLTRYFILLFCAAAVLVPTGVSVLNMIYPYFGELLKSFMNNLGLQYVLGYTGYFVWGWYLANRLILSKRTEIVIYILGIAAFLIGVCVPIVFSHGEQYVTWTSDNFSITVFLQTVAIFTFAKNHLNRPANRLGSELVADSFGVYLIHFVLADIMCKKIDIQNTGVFSFAIVLAITIVVYMVSNLLAAGLRRCPVIKKLV